MAKLAKKATAKQTAKKTAAKKKPSRAPKYVYSFGGGKADGNESMKNLLGGKGANLAEMAGHPSLRLPVPPGFTITTEVCTYYYENKQTYPKELKAQVSYRARGRREAHGQEIRRPHQPASRLGALRRAQVHARHDGDGPQRRPDDQDDPRPDHRTPATSASSTTPTAA